MIRALDGEEHERLWRSLQKLVASSGARAALLCDASSGAPLVSVGDAGAQGAPDEVRALSRSERVVRGPAGEMYGVDVEGGAMLAVLYDDGAFEKVRKAATKSAREASSILLGKPQRRAAKKKHIKRRAR